MDSFQFILLKSISMVSKGHFMYTFIKQDHAVKEHGDMAVWPHTFLHLEGIKIKLSLHWPR